jgi:aldose 1-epimerase
VRLSIDPEVGGRIARLEVAGLSLLVAREADPIRWGSYPMIPWAGRVRRGRFDFDGSTYTLPINMAPHAIHGTTLARAWKRESDEVLSIDLGPDWPFAGRAVQRFQLDEDGLSLRLEVHSDADPFPASLGWHPWFRRELERGAPVELAFSAEKMFAVDDDGIPTGEFIAPKPRPWDDCFHTIHYSPSLTWPGALRLIISSEASHWVVYDEPVHAICVEPMTGPPNALNIAPEIVSPGRPLLGEVRWSWERLKEEGE